MREYMQEMNKLQVEQANLQALEEQRRLDDVEQMRVRSEKERQGNESSMCQQNNANSANPSQSVRGFKIPRRTSMFDIFRD